jgi:pimeloyl-ACP methyl ester carboxylesterase
MMFQGIFFVLVLATDSSSAFAPMSLAAGRYNDFVSPTTTTTTTTQVAAQSPVIVVDTASAETAATAMTAPSSSFLQDFQLTASSTRLPYSPTGYSTWKWKTHHNAQNHHQQQQPSVQTTHSINYLEVGDPSKPAILLVHGFGASSYHWRYNIPILAQKYHVYALDLLGFGWSDKPIMDYDASVWRDQVVDFVNEVILVHAKDKKVAIAGNSLGGYTAMYASSDDRIKDNVSGCILLNAAGRFRDPEVPDDNKAEPNPIIKSISSAIQRFVIACSFVYTKQPARIEQILRQVYPINDAYVDSELVESIRTPALDSSAAEVFYRVITKTGSGKQPYVDDILKELDTVPVLLAWGESDPWIRSAAADKIQRLHAEFHKDDERSWIKRVSIDAGHCPHDEAPEAVNDAILEFADTIFGSQ